MHQQLIHINTALTYFLINFEKLLRQELWKKYALFSPVIFYDLSLSNQPTFDFEFVFSTDIAYLNIWKDKFF